MTAKNWNHVHDDDKQAAMRHWSRRPRLPVPAQMESDRTLSQRIAANIDTLQRLHELDCCIFGINHQEQEGRGRWPFNRPGIAE